MPGDPVLAAGIADYLAVMRETSTRGLSLDTARLMADLTAERHAYARPDGMIVTTSFAVGTWGETPLRIYRSGGEEPQPAILYCHGGGFTTGSVESYDAVATALAEATGATVISAHYARLPESTPRTMLEQCYETLLWTARMAVILGVDARRIAVAGDSAGAFIATLLAVMARDRGGPGLVCQILCYGIYDLDETRPGYRTARDPVLTLPVLTAMIEAYRACDARNPASLLPPLGCEDLSKLPPALIVGAEHDPVLDEGRDYAERLSQAGVAVQLHVAPGMPHGFLRAVSFSAPARAEMRRLGAAFRSLTEGLTP